MAKKIKRLIALALAMVMLTGNAISVCAKEPENLKLVDEYTENGAHIKVYEVISNKSQVMPRRFPVYKEVAITVEFEGWIIPSETYSYKAYDEEFKTTMSGTLYLSTYSQDIWYIPPQKMTRALYKGTVAGNI